MSKKITLFILNSKGRQIKQTTISSFTIVICILIMVAGLIGTGAIGYDYIRLRKTLINTNYLENKVQSQTEDIKNQRKQLQLFAKEINDLKTRIVSLNNFETKIRIIANLEKSDDQNNLFGIGGSIPEDLDTSIPVAEKHNSLIREMHQQVDQLDILTQDQRESFTSLIKDLNEQKNLLASTPAIRPTTGWITSRFGYRKSPFTNYREFHKGLDIGARQGTPVVATADGKITFTGRKGLLGNCVIIDHGHGIITRYGHLFKIVKKRGEHVKRGEVIGKVGNTGRSTGPHLHYEVHLNGVPINPIKYILN